MRPIAAITGLAAALLLAGCGSTGGGGSPSTSTGAPVTTTTTESSEGPAAGELGVELTGGNGVKELEGSWYVHGWKFDFSVTVTAPSADASEDPLTLALTFPSPAMRVEGTEGDGWECSDVDSGISCTTAATAEPGQAWPALKVNAIAAAYSMGESLTAEASGPGKGTATTGLQLDTSG